MRFPRVSAPRSGPGAGPGADVIGGSADLDELLRRQVPVSEGGPAGPGSGPAGTGSGGRALSLRARLARLAAGVDGSRRREGGARDVQRIMNALGALVIGLGIMAVILGWYGASHSPYLYQEIPYLISGGLLGVALVIAGTAAFLGSWALRQIQESRRDARTVVAALERLERTGRALAPPGVPPGTTVGARGDGEGSVPEPYVRTSSR